MSPVATDKGSGGLNPAIIVVIVLILAGVLVIPFFVFRRRSQKTTLRTRHIGLPQHLYVDEDGHDEKTFPIGTKASDGFPDVEETFIASNPYSYADTSHLTRPPRALVSIAKKNRILAKLSPFGAGAHRSQATVGLSTPTSPNRAGQNSGNSGASTAETWSQIDLGSPNRDPHGSAFTTPTNNPNVREGVSHSAGSVQVKGAPPAYSRVYLTLSDEEKNNVQPPLITISPATPTHYTYI